LRLKLEKSLFFGCAGDGLMTLDCGITLTNFLLGGGGGGLVNSFLDFGMLCFFVDLVIQIGDCNLILFPSTFAESEV